MRKFTEQENDWIKELVEIKDKGISHIDELQVARILRNNFSFFALKWTYEPIPQIFLYNKKETPETDKLKTEKQYYAICDFIYFIKELERLSFIAIQKVSSNENKSEYLLYDMNRYTYNKKEDRFELKDKPDNLDLFPQHLLVDKLSSGVYGISQINTQYINLDFANDLNKYGLGIIYPLPLAKDYVDNGFKTLEERYHDTEMGVALKSVKWSQRAVWIAVIALFSSVFFDIRQMCFSQKIDPDQIVTIETAIKNNQIDEPSKVEIKDTILTKPVRTDVQTTIHANH